MEEQLIKLETAQLAKQKGFDLIVNDFYYIQGFNTHLDNGDGDSEFRYLDHNKYDNYYSAPPQSILQKWLRDVHNIEMIIRSWSGKTFKQYSVDVWSIDKEIYKKNMRVRTYEEALEIGLVTGLSLI